MKAPQARGKGPETTAPALTHRPPSVFDHEYKDFRMLEYQHRAPIKAPVAV
jgi:thymidylate synthase